MYIPIHTFAVFIIGGGKDDEGRVSDNFEYYSELDERCPPPPPSGLKFPNPVYGGGTMFIQDTFVSSGGVEVIDGEETVSDNTYMSSDTGGT